MNNVSLTIQTDVVNKLRRDVEHGGRGGNCPFTLQGGTEFLDFKLCYIINTKSSNKQNLDLEIKYVRYLSFITNGNTKVLV